MAKVQNDSARLGAAYRRGVALIALLVLPASAVLILLAPEVIALVLGAKWGPVVTPFRILGIGMLFRTSYKMSDSITRSTGAVYRRAWRQMLYAALVVAGAWTGSHWGIAGVAVGALSAVCVNFFLMADLGLTVAGLSWAQFWIAHRPAVLLTLATFPFVWGTATLLRGRGLPSVVVLIAAGLVFLIVGGVLIWRMAAAFLGHDGQWMANTMRDFVRKLFRPAALRPKLGGAFEPDTPEEAR
jgi:PST family polysaccharide transporter